MEGRAKPQEEEAMKNEGDIKGKKNYILSRI